jgi:hypothetical protein
MEPQTSASLPRAGHRTLAFRGRLAVAAVGGGASPAVAAVDLRESRSVVGEWLTGARPLVGGAAAASLMLLACSWFALESGALGRSADVGDPGPVELHVPAVGATSRAPVASPTRPRAEQPQRRASPPTPTEPAVAQPVQPVAVAPATNPSPAPPAPTPPPAAAPTSDPATPVSAVSEVVDEVVPPVTVSVPTVTVPAITVSAPIVSVSTPPISITSPAIAIP